MKTLDKELVPLQSWNILRDNRSNGLHTDYHQTAYHSKLCYTHTVKADLEADHKIMDLQNKRGDKFHNILSTQVGHLQKTLLPLTLKGNKGFSEQIDRFIDLIYWSLQFLYFLLKG